MEIKKIAVKGEDVLISLLVPLKTRSANPHALKRLKASLETSGLIEPLLVCYKSGTYYILDGYLRYTLLMEMGEKKIPCYLMDSMDSYTPNKYVNNVSPIQERRMFLQALKTVTPKAIATAFGTTEIRKRLVNRIAKSLCEEAIQLFDEDVISRICAHDLVHVSPERQRVILLLMKEVSDFSTAFVRAQVLKTKNKDRRNGNNKTAPWNRRTGDKRNLVKKLVESEKSYDFYTTLYRQYTSDLVKLSIYIRQLVGEPSIAKFVKDNYLPEFEFFNKVLKENALES